MNEVLDEEPEAPRRRARPLILAVPIFVFLVLAAVFYSVLMSGKDPSQIPSALIGKPVPDFELPPLEGLVRDGAPVPGFADEDLAGGGISVVNVWASWCGPCREEHPYLSELAAHGGLPLYGLNYKDKADNARRFLGQLGNPFTAVGADESGRVAIDWGVYGVPETFIVDGAGVIRYKHVGPLNAEKLMALREIIDRVRAQGTAAPATVR